VTNVTNVTNIMNVMNVANAANVTNGEVFMSGSTPAHTHATRSAHGSGSEHGSEAGGRPPTRRYGLGFWLIGAVFATAMAFSTVPTPLYPLYQQRDGFSTFMVTIVFAVYAGGVLASLLLAGHVSDWFGRRKVLITALLLELVAAVMFLTRPSLPVLLVARVVTGLGVGMLTATATAHLQELHSTNRPKASARRFEVVSAGANMGGLALGPLISGFLAQYLGAPLRLPYFVFSALLLIAIAAVVATPETVKVSSNRPPYRPQRISAGHGDRAGYIAAVTAAFASFAVCGLFTSLAPAFISGTLHHPSRALAGSTVFAVFAAAALAQMFTSPLDAQRRWTIGLLAQAAGLVALAMSVHVTDIVTFIVAGIVAGAGAGVLFASAIGTVAAMAPPGKRGEILAGLFFIAYLGLAVPPIGVGIAIRSMSVAAAMTWFAGILLVLLAAVTVLGRRSGGTTGGRRSEDSGPRGTDVDGAR
jgi:MFS family permease